MKTTENNKLIAEFMGYKLFGGNKYCIDSHPAMRLIHKGLVNTSIDYTPEQMKFRTSWDWLIPALGKLNEAILSSPVQSMHSSIHFTYTDIPKHIMKNDIDKAYEAIVKVLKYYNQNMKP